ncbi:MFS general substrate transporter [Rhodofomes roseus]|uniref:MFS general substrate transporter n=1 Tax=Rhodofomes roseus TaxID=34475 RepID=A0ABQ8K3M5_9APHY|nr:MFS general substrate transporter [Rhodofomes roseus]KAH9831436.1 MFS general substrate transporter [Rhodofomes roseus]
MADLEMSKERISCDAPTLVDPQDIPEPAIDRAKDAVEGGVEGWLTVLGAFLLLFCSFGQLNAFGTFQAYYADHQLKHMSPSAISWIGSLQLWIFFFSGGFIGRLFDEYGPRVLMLPGTLLLVLSIMITSVSSSYYEFLFIQGFLFGLGVGLVFYPSLAAVSTHFSRYRGTALGIAIAGSGAGGLVYPIMFQRLFSEVGFGWAVRISGFFCFALCAVALAFVTRRKPEQKQPRPWFDLKLLKDTRFMLVVGSSFFISFGLFVPNFYIVEYATARGVSSTMAFYVLAIMNGASIFGRLAPPFLSDALGRFNLIVPCAFFSGLLALALWTTARGLPAIIVFSVLYGFVSGGFNALIIPCVVQISGAHEIGTRVGMLYTLISFSSMGGGPAAGALLHTMGGSFTGVAALIGASMIFGSFLLLWARLSIKPKIWARV